MVVLMQTNPLVQNFFLFMPSHGFFENRKIMPLQATGFHQQANTI